MDTLIVDDISSLEDMEMNHTVACVPTFAQQAQFKARNDYQFEKWDRPDRDIGGHFSVNSGVILFDNKKWIDNDMTSKFIEVVKDERISSKFVVQGYLSIILEGKFDYLEKDLTNFLVVHRLFLTWVELV